MLVVKRTVKTESIIGLLQSYHSKLSKTQGSSEKKKSILLSHSGLNSPLFNVISGFKEPSNVLNIAALLEKAKSLGKSFLWVMHHRNVNLGQYLMNQGLVKREALQAFYYKLSNKVASYESHPAVKMVEVDTEELFYEWCQVFSSCHGIPFEEVCEYFKSGYGESRFYQLFLAQVYQKSIACSAMYINDEKALLLWDSVLPMYRRQGVGSMMILSRMKIAKENGCKAAYAFGVYSLASLFKSVGFRAFTRFEVLCFDQDITLEEDG